MSGSLFFLAIGAGYSSLASPEGQELIVGFLSYGLSLCLSEADVNLPDQGLSTPLHWACRYGHQTAVQLLLQALKRRSPKGG